MSIRRTITLLTVPLFLLLAIVNGALLYFQEKAEMAEALRNQALAAAVTSADFISAMDDPQEELREPLRARALTLAAGQIPALDALYYLAPDAEPRALIPTRRPWAVANRVPPAEVRALPVQADSAGRHYVGALAPTSGRGFVAARIDAEPMFARMAAIRQAVLLIVAVAGLIAAALAWFVARRIVSELDANRRAIARIGAGTPLAANDGLAIREVRDLADAVRLMDASREAAAGRSRRVTAHRDRTRNLASAVAARRATLFAPIAKETAGARLAVRMCGDAPAGSFFALATEADRGVLVLGRCAAPSPAEGLTRAAEAKRFIEENALAMPLEACLSAAGAGHAVEASRIARWSADDPLPADVRLLVLAEDGTAERSEAFAARHGDAAPAELLDAIERLLEPDGIFVAISR